MLLTRKAVVQSAVPSTIRARPQTVGHLRHEGTARRLQRQTRADCTAQGWRLCQAPARAVRRNAGPRHQQHEPGSSWGNLGHPAEDCTAALPCNEAKLVHVRKQGELLKLKYAQISVSAVSQGFLDLPTWLHSQSAKTC